VVIALSLAGWSFVLATASVVIAVATFFTNRQAMRREQADRKKAIDDAWAFEWAAQRPVVYPVLSRVGEFGELPVKNGGRGPALNVVAEIECPESDGEISSWRAAIGTVAVGDIETKQFYWVDKNPKWDGVSGVLHYSDLAGGEYAHPFHFSHGQAGRLELTVGEQQHRTPAEVATG
jgi:hypothetical protein